MHSYECCKKDNWVEKVASIKKKIIESFRTVRLFRITL